LIKIALKLRDYSCLLGNRQAGRGTYVAISIQLMILIKIYILYRARYAFFNALYKNTILQLMM